MRIAAVSAATLSVCAAYADLGDQLFKLVADDATSVDFLGYAVGIDGTTAVAGAINADFAGVNTGAVYVFDTASGLQTLKIGPADLAVNSEFAGAVAICGDTLIVGAREDDELNVNAGAVYIFTASTGQQLFKLFADDGGPNDNFGVSVAISGTTAIVGANLDDDGGLDAGAAYLFDVTTGQQLFKLTTDDIMPADRLGISVAIDGDIAIVGAYWDDDNGLQFGSAYLFDIATGQHLFKLVPDDGFELDWFGISVSVSGSIAVVGASQDDDSGPDSGSAYLYDITTGQLLFKLLATEGLFSDEFGWSVAICGATAVVGAKGAANVFINGDRTGAAYFFDTSTGQQTQRILASDGDRGDLFGYGVGVSGNTAIFGAWGNDEIATFAGAAYLFATSNCLADLNSDGVIDTADLGALLGLYGSADPGADINADGVVDTADLGILLGEFGTGCL